MQELISINTQVLEVEVALLGYHYDLAKMPEPEPETEVHQQPGMKHKASQDPDLATEGTSKGTKTGKGKTQAKAKGKAAPQGRGKKARREGVNQVEAVAEQASKAACMSPTPATDAAEQESVLPQPVEEPVQRQRQVSTIECKN